MQENFHQVKIFVQKDEGPYSNHPADSGGPTRYGITIHDLRRWRKDKTLDAADVKAMPEDEVYAIYKKWYWDAVSADVLPSGLDYFMFDSGLLSGTQTAIKWLQRAVGTKPDGKIGPKTLEAVRAADTREIIEKVEKLRRASLKSLKRLWPIFGRGWTNRVNKSKARALKLCAKV